MPIAFLSVGLATYIYYGITWNAWMKNLPNIVIYIVIIAALAWALKTKDRLNRENQTNN